MLRESNLDARLDSILYLTGAQKYRSWIDGADNDDLFKKLAIINMIRTENEPFVIQKEENRQRKKSKRRNDWKARGQFLIKWMKIKNATKNQWMKKKMKLFLQMNNKWIDEWTRPSPSQVFEWKEDEGEKANNNETSWWNV